MGNLKTYLIYDPKNPRKLPFEVGEEFMRRHGDQYKIVEESEKSIELKNVEKKTVVPVELGSNLDGNITEIKRRYENADSKTLKKLHEAELKSKNRSTLIKWIENKLL